MSAFPSQEARAFPMSALEIVQQLGRYVGMSALRLAISISSSIASLCCSSTHLHISGAASLAKFAGKFGSMRVIECKSRWPGWLWLGCRPGLRAAP
jgi:hypothetical protein